METSLPMTLQNAVMRLAEIDSLSTLDFFPDAFFLGCVVAFLFNEAPMRRLREKQESGVKCFNLRPFLSSSDHD